LTCNRFASLGLSAFHSRDMGPTFATTIALGWIMEANNFKQSKRFI
jgi:hypothetical protein